MEFVCRLDMVRRVNLECNEGKLRNLCPQMKISERFGGFLGGGREIFEN
jgi:hypothetical protein